MCEDICDWSRVVEAVSGGGERWSQAVCALGEAKVRDALAKATVGNLVDVQQGTSALGRLDGSEVVDNCG